MNRRNIGDIKTFRSKRGWTQAELAKHLKVAKQLISRVELGTSTPGLRAAVAIEAEIGIACHSWIPRRYPGGTK